MRTVPVLARRRNRLGSPTPAPVHTLAFSLNLALAMAVSTFPSAAIGTLAVVLRDDLGIDRGHVGLLATTFQSTSAAFSLWLGARVAVLGGRRGLLLLHGWVAVGFALAALSPGYLALVLAVGFLGVAAGANNPLTNYAITEHALPGQRGAMVGVKQSGVLGSVLISGAVLPWLAAWGGWRAAMFGAVALPIGGLLATKILVPETPKVDGAIAVRPRMGDVAREHPFLIWLAVYAGLMGASLSSMTLYLPSYAFDELGFSVQRAGLVGSSLGLFGVLARVFWGRAVEHRGHRLTFDLLSIAVGSASMAGLVLAASHGATWMVWIGALGIGATATSWNVIANMAAIRDLPQRTSAAGSGIIQLGFCLGLVCGPLVFARMLGEHGNYSRAILVDIIGFASGAIVTLLWRRSNRRSSTSS